MSATVIQFKPKPNASTVRRKVAAKKKPQPLSLATLKALANSGLTEADARIMGIEDVTGESCPELAGTTDSGYRFVYYNFDGKPLEPDFYRIRRHEMPSTPKFGAKPVKTDCPKYLQPAGSGVHAYLSRRIDWNADVLADQHQTIPVIFTEGEKKAEAACKAGLITVGLGGVDAFASSKQDIDLLPDLAKLAKNRRVRIVYDSDITHKDDVRRARKKLALQIYLAGGFPEFIDLPSDGDDKVGLDDYLLKHSKKDFLALPRQEITPQLLIRWLHNKKKEQKLGFDPEATARLIGRVVTQAMAHGGQFLQTDTAEPELLYHDKKSAKIFGLDEGRGRQLRAFVESTYTVNGADPQWKQVHEQAANYCQTHGPKVAVHKLSFYDRRTHTLYIARSEGEMFKITARGRKVVPNGTDQIFIRTNGRLTDIEPAATGTRQAFEKVSRVANFKDDVVMSGASAALLWETWELSVFFPQLMATRPLVVFTGDPESRKTSAGRAFGRTLLGPHSKSRPSTKTSSTALMRLSWDARSW